VPRDRSLLNPGLAQMSEQSRYLRFMAPVEQFSAGQLDYLTFVDHHDHEAILAFDAVTGEGVGIARYVRTSRRTAEAAVSVADAWHGRGLGGELVRFLAERAQDEGVRVFSAQTFATNEPSMRMLERLGRTRRSGAGSAVQVRVRLRDRRPPGRRASAWLRRTLLSQCSSQSSSSSA
jgi:RimJ/RimL family protein N-acetyltransferase